MPQFPILDQLNQGRTYLAENSHLKESEEFLSAITIQRIGTWIAHKALTVVCLPVNATAAAGALAGAAAAGCLVGGIKIATFAITLGNVKPSYPTGTIWFAKRAASAAYEVLKNIAELFYDLGDALYQGFRALRWVFTRIEKGFQKANEDESGFTFKEQFLFPHKLINDEAKKYRIDLSSSDRSMEYIAKHAFYSLVNIPTSCLTAVLSGCLVTPLFTAVYLGKAFLYAGTNIHIPVPTYAGKAIEVSTSAGLAAIEDTLNVAADIFVTMYKISSALKLNRALATARDVVLYIPEAVFG